MSIVGQREIQTQRRVAAFFLDMRQRLVKRRLVA